MANNKFILTLLACCALWAACSDDDAVDESKAYPAVITAQSFNFGATTGTTWSKSQTIGVYMLNSGTNDIIAPYGNLRYYANNRTDQDYFLPGSNDSIPYFPPTGESRDIAAYYPRTTTVVADTLIGINIVDNYTYASQLLFSRVSGLNKDNRKAVLELRPALSQLTFNYTAGYGRTASDLVGITTTLRGLPVSGNFNTTTGTIDFRNTSTQDITLTTTAASSTRADATTTYTASGMVLPSSTTEGYTIVITLPAIGETREYEVPKATETLTSGIEYTLDIRINDLDLIVSVQESPITNWQQGGIIISGSGTEQN